MKFRLLVVLGFFIFTIGCGSGIPSGSPDDSSDEALVKSAFEYEIKLVQKFFIPKFEKSLSDYISRLEELEMIYGGPTMVDVSQKIERMDKLQLAISEYKKSWKDAKATIIERSEATEHEVRDCLRKKLQSMYRILKKDYEAELDKLGNTKEDLETEKKIIQKVAEPFVPKANAMLEEVGFKNERLKKEDVTDNLYNPSLPDMKEVPYEVVQNFRKIKTHVKYPVLKFKNNEFETDFDTRYVTYTVINIDNDWFLDSFDFGDVYARYFTGSDQINDVMMFANYDIKKDLSTQEEAAKTAANVYFLSSVVRNSYDTEFRQEYLDIQDNLGEWVYLYDPEQWSDMKEQNDFIDDNMSDLLDAKVEIKYSEVKKINANFDVSIEYLDVADNNDEVKAEGDNKEEKDAKKKKGITSETGQYKLEEKTIYVRAYLNLLNDEWRIVRVEKVNEPRKVENKTE